MWKCPECKGFYNLDERCRCKYDIQYFDDDNISDLLVEIEIKQEVDQRQSVSPDKKGLRNLDNSKQAA